MADVMLTIPDEWMPTYTRFQAENGTNWAVGYIVEKLRELAQRHTLADGQRVYDAYKLLPQTERDRLKLDV